MAVFLAHHLVNQGAVNAPVENAIVASATFTFTFTFTSLRRWCEPSAVAEAINPEATQRA
jgi:hypothetical protein